MEKPSFDEIKTRGLGYHEPGPSVPAMALQEVVLLLEKTSERIPPREGENQKNERFNFLAHGMDHFVNRISDPKRRREMQEQMLKKDWGLTQCYLLAGIQARITDLIFKYRGAPLLPNTQRAIERFLARGDAKPIFHKAETYNFNLKGPRGMATAIALLTKDPEQQFYYPDPFLDIVAKTDLITFDRAAQRYAFWQIKATQYASRDLIPLSLNASAFLSLDRARRDRLLNLAPALAKDKGKLKDDLATLDEFTRALARKYREPFEAKLMIVPSSSSPDYPIFFDALTGLPKKEFFAMLQQQQSDPQNLLPFNKLYSEYTEGLLTKRT